MSPVPARPGSEGSGPCFGPTAREASCDEATVFQQGTEGRLMLVKSCCYRIATRPETNPILLAIRAFKRVKKSTALNVSTTHLSPPLFQDHLAEYLLGS
jgi:hypothetical protein